MQIARIKKAQMRSGEEMLPFFTASLHKEIKMQSINSVAVLFELN